MKSKETGRAYVIFVNETLVGLSLLRFNVERSLQDYFSQQKILYFMESNVIQESIYACRRAYLFEIVKVNNR